jgi:hypothetical protein
MIEIAKMVLDRLPIRFEKLTDRRAIALNAFRIAVLVTELRSTDTMGGWQPEAVLHLGIPFPSPECG